MARLPIPCPGPLAPACLVILFGCGGGSGSGNGGGGTTPAPFTLSQTQEAASTCAEMFLSARGDALGRPYVYVAAKEGGLKVFESGTGLSLRRTLPASLWGGLHAMNLSQQGSLLLVALGNHFGTDLQAAGVAFVDVSDPLNPALKGVWSDGTLRGGCGIAVSDGRYAYLGAMGNGLVILDALDPVHPAFVSRFVPSLDFPDAQPDPAKVNARGIFLQGGTLYLAFDAGGLRILDVSDKARPREAGRWSNPVMNGKPRAYNNVVVDGTTAYVAVDYCGVEALDVSNPAAVRLLSWWNPWNCQAGAPAWFTSDGHANELALDKAKKLLFVSSGKSDLQVLDLSAPGSPAWLQEFGGTANGMGTWGVSIQGGRAYLTYICAFIPFSSAWTGVKVLSYSR